jgi:polar amino acid transport system substrate-binding protein
MKNKILVLLLALVMLVAFTACSSGETEEPAEAVEEGESAGEEVAEEALASGIDMAEVKLMNQGQLTVGVEIGYPPFEDFAEDGTTPIGYDIDFGYALADKLGLELVHINTAWDGIFQGIDANYDVVISAVTITDERKESMSFSSPYINNYQAVVVPMDYEGEITSFNDLDGMSIAVQKETTSDVLISDYVDTGSIVATVSANEKITTCFTQLDNGEVDVVVVDSTVADGYIASNPDKFMLAYLDESEPEQFGVAMGKDNTALQTAINEAIDQLYEEGFFEENVEHWFGSSN